MGVKETPGPAAESEEEALDRLADFVLLRSASSVLVSVLKVTPVSGFVRLPVPGPDFKMVLDMVWTTVEDGARSAPITSSGISESAHNKHLTFACTFIC
jgi:hypothetical protein